MYFNAQVNFNDIDSKFFSMTEIQFAMQYEDCY